MFRPIPVHSARAGRGLETAGTVHHAGPVFLQRREAISGTTFLYVLGCGARGSGRNNLACAVISSSSALPL